MTVAATTMAATVDLDVDVLIEAEGWMSVADALEICRGAAQASYAHIATDPGRAEACVVLSSDAHVQELNRTWRGQDRPTDVLSFPLDPSPLDPSPPDPGLPDTALNDAPRMLGDIVVAFETTAAAAAELDMPLAHHLSHLVVHGMLHLLGFDHMTDDEAEEMERLEVDVLAILGIPDPYARGGGAR